MNDHKPIGTVEEPIRCLRLDEVAAKLALVVGFASLTLYVVLWASGTPWILNPYAITDFIVRLASTRMIQSRGEVPTFESAMLTIALGQFMFYGASAALYLWWKARWWTPSHHPE